MNNTEREICSILKDLDYQLNHVDNFMELDYYDDAIDLIKQEIGYNND